MDSAFFQDVHQCFRLSVGGVKFQMIPPVRRADRAHAQKCGADKGCPAAAPGRNRSGYAAKDRACGRFPQHAQGNQQPAAVGLGHGEHTGPLAAQALIAGEGEHRRDFQPLFHQQKDPLGQRRAFHFINHLHPAPAAEPQGGAGLGQGADLAEHAAMLFRMNPQKLPFYLGRKTHLSLPIIRTSGSKRT